MFGMSFETKGKQTLGQDIPGYPGNSGAPKKFENQWFVFCFGPIVSLCNLPCEDSATSIGENMKTCKCGTTPCNP